MSYVAKKVRTRYVVGQGKSKRYVAKGTPGARRVKVTSRDYHGFWIGDGGKKECVRFKNCPEKQAADVRLREHLRKLALHEAGLGPHPKKVFAWEESSIDGHLQAYLQHLRTAPLDGEPRSARYIAEVERQVRAVCEGVGATVMRELTADKVSKYLSQLAPRGDPPRSPSARTRETYRQAVCYFTAWLAKDRNKGLPADPLASLARIKGEAVRSRRSLDQADLQRLLNAARERPLSNFSHITKGKRRTASPAGVGDAERERLLRAGLQRALVYKTAVLTLARFGAIRKLTVDALQLDASPPHAVFPAKNVKGRRAIIKPLPPELVQDLRAWLKLTGKTGTDPVFNLNTQITRELRKDLEFAGIPYKDGLGRTFDFHAFKKCGVTALARAGVNLLAIKDYAEHADVRLTTEAYRDSVGQQPMDEVFLGLPRIH